MFFPFFLSMLSISAIMTMYFFSPQPSMLTLLLILEAATLSSLASISFFFWSSLSMTMFLTFIFVTFSACGASLGLATLVSMVRFWGTDTLNSSSIISC